MIDPDVVQRTAELARLSIDDITALTARLERIVAFFDQLDEVDTADVEPLHAPSRALGQPRADEAGVSIGIDAIRDVAPRVEGPYFAVPKTVE